MTAGRSDQDQFVATGCIVTPSRVAEMLPT